MPRGPLPNPQRRRRNAPTIPTRELSAAGRGGRPPTCPYSLASAGRAWWLWAWHTPQALAWDDGALYVVARRAQLEDDVQALDAIDDLFDQVKRASKKLKDQVAELHDLVGALKGMAGGRTTVMREMRELDDRLGLSPKGLAALRWTIVAPAEEAGDQKPAEVRRLHAVDAKAAAGG